MRPPRTGRRLICFWERLATGGPAGAGGAGGCDGVALRCSAPRTRLGRVAGVVRQRDGDGPTEADLLQLSVGADDVAPAVRMGVRRVDVDVLVHHRGLQQLPGASASVLLLIRRMTGPAHTWKTLSIPNAFAGQVVAALGGTLPAGGKFAGGWTIADTTPVRQPVGNLDAAHPQATSFEVIFPTTTKNDLSLILAVCTSATFPAPAARLAGATLGAVLTNSPHTACHLLAIKVAP
jgi:hypothetical protein